MPTKILFIGEQIIFKKLLELLASQKTYTDGIPIFNITPAISSMPIMRESEYGPAFGPPYWQTTFTFDQQPIINCLFCLKMPEALGFMFQTDERTDYYLIQMTHFFEEKMIILTISYIKNYLFPAIEEDVFNQQYKIPQNKTFWEYVSFNLDFTPIIHLILNHVLFIPKYAMISHAALSSVLLPLTLQQTVNPTDLEIQRQFQDFTFSKRTLVFSQNSTFGSALIDFCRLFRIPFIINQQNRDVWMRDAFFECSKNSTPHLYLRTKAHPTRALYEGGSVLRMSNIIHPYKSRGGLLSFDPKFLSDDERQVNLKFKHAEYVHQTAKSLEGGNLFLVQNKFGKVFAIIGLIAVYHDEHLKFIKEGVRAGFKENPQLAYKPLKMHPTKPGKVQLPDYEVYSTETSRILERYFDRHAPTQYTALQSALEDQKLIHQQHPKYSELFRSMVDEICFVENLTFHIDFQMCYLGQGVFFVHSFDVLQLIFPDYYATYQGRGVHGIYERKVNLLISILNNHGFIAVKFCGHLYKKNSNLEEIVWDCDEALDSTLVNGIDVYSMALKKYIFVTNDTPNEKHKEHFEDTIAQIVEDHKLNPIEPVYLCAQAPEIVTQENPRSIFATRHPTYTPAQTVEHVGKYLGGIRCQTNFVRTDAIDSQSFSDTETLLRGTPYSSLPCTKCGADLLHQPENTHCLLCGSLRV